jgi:hypothetical protein
LSIPYNTFSSNVMGNRCGSCSTTATLLASSFLVMFFSDVPDSRISPDDGS